MKRLAILMALLPGIAFADTANFMGQRCQPVGTFTMTIPVAISLLGAGLVNPVVMTGVTGIAPGDQALVGFSAGATVGTLVVTGAIADPATAGKVTVTLQSSGALALALGSSVPLNFWRCR